MGTLIQMTSNFSSEMMEARRKWHIKYWKKKKNKLKEINYLESCIQQKYPLGLKGNKDKSQRKSISICCY